MADNGLHLALALIESDLADLSAELADREDYDGDSDGTFTGNWESKRRDDVERIRAKLQKVLQGLKAGSNAGRRGNRPPSTRGNDPSRDSQAESAMLEPAGPGVSDTSAGREARQVAPATLSQPDAAP